MSKWTRPKTCRACGESYPREAVDLFFDRRASGILVSHCNKKGCKEKYHKTMNSQRNTIRGRKGPNQEVLARVRAWFTAWNKGEV